jgi:peptidoglycan/xylan/chitin deacetylase (PgdA/CDA1 family)
MALKRLIKASLLRCQILQTVGRALPSSVAILRYHSVQKNPYDCANTIGYDITHSADELDAHMRLVRERFVPITLDDILQCVEHQQALPRRAVAVTFDDGYLDNYEVAAPILARYGVRAAFYVSVGWINSSAVPWFCRLRHGMFSTRMQQWDGGRNIGIQKLNNERDRTKAFLAGCYACATLTGDDQELFLRSMETQLEVEEIGAGRRLMMNWDELRQLQGAGHIVGSHTVTHPNVAQIDEELVFREMSDAKTTLEENLGRTIEHFSYPAPCLQPHWTEATIAIARKVGYRTAVTSMRGSARSQHDPHCLPRLVCSRDVQQLRWDIESSFLGRLA